MPCSDGATSSPPTSPATASSEQSGGGGGGEEEVDLVSKTREDLHWCLEQLESMSSSRSVSDLASAKFKRLLSRELNNLTDSRQIRDYIEGSFFDNTLELDLVTLAAGIDPNPNAEQQQHAVAAAAAGQNLSLSRSPSRSSSVARGADIPSIDGVPLRPNVADGTQKRADAGAAAGLDGQSLGAAARFAIGSTVRLSAGIASAMPNSISSPALSQMSLPLANRSPAAPRACSIAVAELIGTNNRVAAGSLARAAPTANGGTAPDSPADERARMQVQVRPETFSQFIPGQGTRTASCPPDAHADASTTPPSISINKSDPPPITIVPPSPAQSHSPSPSSTYTDLTIVVPNGCASHAPSTSSTTPSTPSPQLAEKSLVAGTAQSPPSNCVYTIPAGFINECSPLHLIGPAISFLASGTLTCVHL